MHAPLRTRSLRQAFTITEVLITLTITGLLLAAVAVQLIESSTLGLKTASTLEHVRNSRQLVTGLSSDVRSAQQVLFYPSFTDRSKELVDGESGNYLVLRFIGATGTIDRTIGYYRATAGGEWRLYRHDSKNGDHAANVLPLTSTSGTHRVTSRAVEVAGAGGLFTRLRTGGVVVRGQFGKAPGATLGRSDYVRFAVSTRS